MKPQLDSTYVYRSTTAQMLGSFEKLDKRKHDSYTFKRGNVLETSDNIYRYAQTFTIDNVERTLLLVTLDGNKTNVGKFFKQAVKEIKEDDTMMNIWTVVESKPELIGIDYVY